MVPFVGPSHPLPLDRVDLQRSINLYPVSAEDPGEKSETYMAPTPGLTQFSAAPRLGLLDPWRAGLSGAFGRVLLRGNYGGPFVRLSRSTDGAQMDFGPVNNASFAPLDWAAIITWLGGATGRVVKWYDQSGLARELQRGSPDNGVRVDTSGQFLFFDGATGNTLDSTAACGQVPSMSAMLALTSWGTSSYAYAFFYNLGSRPANEPGGYLAFNSNNPSSQQCESAMSDGAGGALNNSGYFGQISNLAGSPTVFATRWTRPSTPPSVFVNSAARTIAPIDTATLAANFAAKTWRLGGYGEGLSNNALLRAKMFATWEAALSDADMIACSNAVAAGS